MTNSTIARSVVALAVWVWLSMPWLVARGEQTPNLALDTAERVLVLRNANSPISGAVTDDYTQRRALHHVLNVACPDAAADTKSETISFQRFQESIVTPLAAFLAAHPGVDFIVLTKGIPIRLADAPQGRTQGPLSVDSYLASRGYETLPEAVRVDVTDPGYGPGFHGMAWANRFWNSRQPFSHARFGGYLVSRLDGYTESDAKALTTRSLAAANALASGRRSSAAVLLDVCPGFGFDEGSPSPHSILPMPLASTVKIIQESKFGEFNSDLRWASEILSTRHLPVELDLTDRFIGKPSPVAGYVSWGSNDQKFDAAAYHSLTFIPGALCETAVSTSARTFLPTRGGQSLIADLIAQGVTGAKGYTDEPLLQAVASPSILFERYTRGWTLVESYYAASRLVGWQDVVIGDPLCRSYPASAD